MMGDSFSCWAIKPSTNAPANPPVKVSRTLSSCIVAPRDEPPRKSDRTHSRPRQHPMAPSSDQGGKRTGRKYLEGLEARVEPRPRIKDFVISPQCPNT